MKDRLLHLRKQSEALEPNAAQRETLRKSVLAYTEEFLEQIHDYGKAPAFRHEWIQKEETETDPFQAPPLEIEDLMGRLKHELDDEGLNPASGGHLGYIPGGGIYASSLADYIAAVNNKYAGIYFVSPAAVRMEHALLRSTAKLIGYPASSVGNIASGGSIANLICLVSAREALDITPETIRKTVIYSSEHAHHCLHKAVRIGGLKEAVWRDVPLDEHFRMRPERLREMILNDQEEGLRPALLIASAGTTDMGAIDPLQELADIKEEFGMWMHVDAAYGGYFMLLDDLKPRFRGIERSDSAVLDPHKGLFLPYGTGIALVKHPEPVMKAHGYTANYMQDAQSEDLELSPADLSPELTKHFRALRMWLPLRLHGVEPFRAALEEKRLLALYVAEELRKIPQVELLCDPELSVVTFRIAAGDEALNDRLSEELLTSIHNNGRVFLSSSRVNGKYVLRCAILSFRTHLETVDEALQQVRTFAERLQKVVG